MWKLEHPPCSLLIVTYNRADCLRLTLESLCAQSVEPRSFETIIVDDGSQDHTVKVIEAFSSRLRIRYEYQRNAGIASARNHALFLAAGRIVVFQDDDDIAAPDLVAEHLRTHEANPDDRDAVLGYTSLSPALKADPLMHFVTAVRHWLYSYPSISHGQELDFSYLWGGRSSCKRKFLLEHGVFNPAFRFGCEDIELGYRLSRAGLRVHYNARARTTTFRPHTVDAFCARVERQGRSGWMFSRMHDDPVVHRWARVEQVSEWASLAPQYDALLSAARRTDATVRAKLQMKLAVSADLRPLFDAYESAFHASYIRGMADQSSQPPQPE
jgi:glycosyltransferase involved in cell wall biosynthesis